MARYRHLSVAVPMTDELDNLPALLAMLRRQTLRDFTLYCCVNQPEASAKAEPSAGPAGESKPATAAQVPNPQAPSPATLARIACRNRQTLRLLQQVDDIPIYIIDRCSPGQGWQGKQHGVGWARKVLLDTILQTSGDDELIVSLDADTAFRDDYLQGVLTDMNAHPTASALCLPYYHPLSGTAETDRAMLRYELYMRHYLLSLLLIRNRYAFSALGSAMAFPAWALRRVGGITPLAGGEDFYLMQKFAKTGQIALRTDQCVYPQGRISHRVPFGTGPAIAKGTAGIAAAYPFFEAEGFRQIEETFRLFPALFHGDRETPMSPFLRHALHSDDLWGPLRSNFKRQELFVHACEERVDGLRILQFLRADFCRPERQKEAFFSLWQRLKLGTLRDFDFTTAPISELNDIRNQLFAKEMQMR